MLKTNAMNLANITDQSATSGALSVAKQYLFADLEVISIFLSFAAADCRSEHSPRHEM